MTRTPHTYKRRTITLPPAHDAALVARANRLHRGNISAAVQGLLGEAEGVTSVSRSGNAGASSSSST